MKRTFVRLGIGSLLSTGILACSGNGFVGKSEKANLPQAADGSPSENGGVTTGEVKPPEPGQVIGGKVVVEPVSNKEMEDINNCAKAWGGKIPPFSKNAARKITGLVSVASQGVVLSDQQKTEAPQLTLIYAAVSVAGSPEWELLNPNGWYCIVSAVNVGTFLTVNIDKDAHLAESAIGVNVASETDGPVSAIGVNVGSKIKVVKK